MPTEFIAWKYSSLGWPVLRIIKKRINVSKGITRPGIRPVIKEFPGFRVGVFMSGSIG
jgi:hypothetical protein